VVVVVLLLVPVVLVLVILVLVVLVLVVVLELVLVLVLVLVVVLVLILVLILAVKLTKLQNQLFIIMYKKKLNPEKYFADRSYFFLSCIKKDQFFLKIYRAHINMLMQRQM
jgi:hypothetical protein